METRPAKIAVFKSWAHIGRFQEERRKLFLKRQKIQRGSKTNSRREESLARSSTADLVLDENRESCDTDDQFLTPQEFATSALDKKKQQKKIAESKTRVRLCSPEYFIDKPQDFESGWLVLSRPHGVRCVVIASNGSTVCRTDEDRPMHNFQSALPGGSKISTRKSAFGRSEKVILDCIYDERTLTYHVIDIMQWKDISLFECSAEFRFYWLNTKFTEDCGDVLNISSFNERVFRPVFASAVSYDNVLIAYAGINGCARNKLLFYHKDGHYEAGITPLVLQWQSAFDTSLGIEDSHIAILRLVDLTTVEWKPSCQKDCRTQCINSIQADKLMDLNDDPSPELLLNTEDYISTRTVALESNKASSEGAALVTSDRFVVSLVSSLASDANALFRAHPEIKVGEFCLCIFEDIFVMEEGKIEFYKTQVQSICEHAIEADSLSKLLFYNSVYNGRSISIEDILTYLTPPKSFDQSATSDMMI